MGHEERPSQGSGELEDDTTSGDVSITIDEREWAIFLHASAYTGLIVPFANVIAPFLLWVTKRDDSEFIDESGKHAVNFHITWTLLFIPVLFTVLLGIGFILLPLMLGVYLLLVGIGTYKASERDVYEYPLAYDFID